MKVNKGGQAFNIVNLDYENSLEGEHLRQHHHDAKVRNLVRMQNIDTLNNTDYNVINGQVRSAIDVP